MKSVQERLLQFVRRDGRRDAPFVFLTIEDGGPMQSVPHLNETLDRDGAWEPETRTRLPYSLGMPGVIIPKLMTLFASEGENLSNWRHYRDNALYLNNEINLKFYPIARKKQSDEWPQELTEYTGLDANQYLGWCLSNRPAMFTEQYKDVLLDKTLIVILAERSGWLQVLNQIYTVARHQDVTNQKGRLIYTLYFDADDRLLYAYFPMFRPGVSHAQMKQFSQEVLQHKALSGKIYVPD
tara:strand:+ start:109 stop:825 length:717 start_codon:yes stop_codon:yes gene_type:complete